MYTVNNDSNNLSSRYHSYQQGAGTYSPPGRTTYAEQQTNVILDSVKTQYQAEAAANSVLSQMHVQRHQIKGAHDDVWKMREATESAKREIEDLALRKRQHRCRLYAIISILALVDFVLLLRIIKCGGSFFC